MYSSLFNYAVASSSQACFMNHDGENIKQASLCFQQAAWVFDHLSTLVSETPLPNMTPDLCKESLVMNSQICLAQA